MCIRDSYLDSVVDGILTGLGQQLYTLKINIADSAMRALFIFLLVPLTGFRGVIYVTYFGTLFNATLSIRRLVVVTRGKPIQDPQVKKMAEVEAELDKYL